MSPRFNRAWLSGSRNRFHRGGRPQPIGRKGRKAGIWKVFSLAGRAVGYLVGRGRSSGRPVAMVFGSGRNNHPTAKDYRAARAIAADHRRAARETPHIFDLRNCLPFWLLSIVLMPTDNKGRAVVDCGWAGTMYEFSRHSEDSLQMVTAVAGGGAIPWDKLGRNRHLVARPQIPRFEMAIDGWAPAPPALIKHLDKIDPQPNKNGGLLPVTQAPGQSESREATASAA